jgi:hypothetical protein
MKTEKRERITMTNEEKIHQISLKIDMLYDILENSPSVTIEEICELEDEIEELELSLGPYFSHLD